MSSRNALKTGEQYSTVLFGVRIAKTKKRCLENLKNYFFMLSVQHKTERTSLLFAKKRKSQDIQHGNLPMEVKNPAKFLWKNWQKKLAVHYLNNYGYYRKSNIGYAHNF